MKTKITKLPMFVVNMSLIILLSISNSCGTQKSQTIINDSHTNSYIDLLESLNKIGKRYVPTHTLQRTSSSNEKIDWEKVVYADGRGAIVGLSLSSRSGNPYAIVATTIGVGVYDSMEEYERQKVDTTGMNDALEKTIDIENPFNIDWRNSIPLIDEEIGSVVGEWHNTLLEELFTDEYNIEDFSVEDNITHIIDLFVYLSGITLNEQEISQLLSENINDIGISPEVETIYDTYCDYAFSLDGVSRHLLTTEFLDDIHTAEPENEEAIIIGIMTAYYSSYFWNIIDINNSIIDNNYED